MAEYYPLLAKAVGSLPNSTPETRRVIYERARKALIGQLRTLHPPVPESDIERESIELDRAIDRVENELANSGLPPPDAKPLAPPPPSAARPAAAPAALARPIGRPGPSLDPANPVERKPFMPLKPKMPARQDPSVSSGVPALRVPAAAPDLAVAPAFRGNGPQASRESAPAAPKSLDDWSGKSKLATPQDAAASEALSEPIDSSLHSEPASPSLPLSEVNGVEGDMPMRARVEPQRPIAPQPRSTDGSRRRLWIVPAGIGVVAVIVAVAAYLLRDTRQNVARVAPSEQTSSDNEKVTERVGGTDQSAASTGDTAKTSNSDKSASTETTPPASSNPELPVANRAALLLEAANEPNKVKTFLGRVFWKLNNVNQGPSENVEVAVLAEIDLPEDKMKATVTFEKNTDASLPASHTIKVQFALLPGSISGDVQQISVPQLRQEDSPSGEALSGVTVPVVPNSFLVGLSPGNAEMVNIKQLQETQWIDIPMLLSNGKIAKLTFEKGAAGTRDLNEAIASWQKS